MTPTTTTPYPTPRTAHGIFRVIVFDNFLSDEECDALVELGGQDFTQSVDAGRRLPNGSFASIVSTARTSLTSWCTRDNCVENDLVSERAGAVLRCVALRCVALRLTVNNCFL